ncbi:hypothetical protein FA09DRAFT_361323 [Tilletiopsis washingtonensis]|uniref:Crossover junction endonuclease MUS81 n=1 Tax=Tilletiopsis washingtonensis TaxID=58919 RepID=A0A316Z5G8_9BASI|nr:hypothetical protein FA09DRAFT_361323 [Tilletiopsis washingtonensis]PWN97020.1 hypothetical protein FA09DRAFT_361323 [Tilletiopsis washingtonensis]
MSASTALPLRTLFSNWLKQWRDEAKARHSQSALVFNTAYEALRACPLAFAHPAELAQLAGVGKTLVQRLTERLEAWCEEQGMPMPQRPRRVQDAGSDASSESDADGHARAKARRKAQPAAKAGSSSKASSSRATDKAPAAAKKAPRAYVPAARSGAHGILVAMYAATSSLPESEPEEGGGAGPSGSTDARDYLSKSRIIELATPHADSSYLPRAPIPGAPTYGMSFNTAWSGMKTLVNRGYVYRTGNPPRFGLSSAGFEIAAECAQREGVQMGSAVEEAASDTPAQGSRVRAAKSKTADPPVSTAGSSRPADTSPAKSAAASSAFRFVYLTDARPPLRVLERSRAALRLSDKDYTPTYRIEFPAALAEHVFVRMCLEDVEVENDCAQGWARELGANELAPGLGEEIQVGKPPSRPQAARQDAASRTARRKSPAAGRSAARGASEASRSVSPAKPSEGAPGSFAPVRPGGLILPTGPRFAPEPEPKQPARRAATAPKETVHLLTSSDSEAENLGRGSGQRVHKRASPAARVQQHAPSSDVEVLETRPARKALAPLKDRRLVSDPSRPTGSRRRAMSESESEGGGSEELPDVGELFRGMGRTRRAAMLKESDKPRSKTTQPKKKKARSSEEVIVLD